MTSENLNADNALPCGQALHVIRLPNILYSFSVNELSLIVVYGIRAEFYASGPSCAREPQSPGFAPKFL